MIYIYETSPDSFFRLYSSAENKLHKCVVTLVFDSLILLSVNRTNCRCDYRAGDKITKTKNFMSQLRKTNSFFFRLILSVVVLTILTANSAPASAQKKSEAKPPKTRDIMIYVYDGTLSTEETEFPRERRIVPIRRRIVNNKPLSRALKLLLKGATEDELYERNLSGIATDLEFVSARIKNGTAQINLKFEDEKLVEESWEGSGFRNEDFVKAVELTAKQFPGIERVSICVNGVENYADFGSEPIKCSFGMFKTQH